MQAIMLAAGKGSRLGKYTKNNTKCMLDVHGETLLERAIDALLEAGIKDFILVLGYKKDNVKKFIKESVFLNNYFRMTFAKRALRYAFLIYTKKSRAIASLDSIIFISDWFYTSKSSCSFSAVL